MSRHLPCAVWGFWRRNRDLPGRMVNGHIRTVSQHYIRLALFTDDSGENGLAFDLHRADARMLAKRIYQCLEESK